MRRHRLIARLALAGLTATTPAIAAPAVRADPRSATAVGSDQRRVLRMWASGPDVVRIQRLLGVPERGVFGPATERAVRGFQVAHGLPATGRVDQATWTALLGELAGHSGDVVLRPGDAGPRVSALQRALGMLPTGRFDEATRDAVRRFQATHGLVVDGQAGAGTFQLLRTYGERSNLDSAPGRAAAAPPAARAADAGIPDSAASALGKRAATLSLQYLGTRYVWGGESPQAGFDCSGLVQYVYAQVGVALPRVAADQYGAGAHPDRAQLRPGDLVFFENLGHVGIYIGHNRFVHSPHTGSVVQIASLDGWYAESYAGATRVVS